MRRRAPSRRALERRIEALENLLRQPTPRPLDGQQAIPVVTIYDHLYEGSDTCQADLFGTLCGAHRDEHQHVEEQR